jgi:hypothetical protein
VPYNGKLGGLMLKTSVRHIHGVETYGITFDVDGTTLSFLADTRYFPELPKSYFGTTFLY